MSRMPLTLFVVLGLAVAVGLGTAVAPFASSNPDGLEKVAIDKGFVDDGRAAAIHADSPIPDYAFPGVENERLATGLAGFVGALGTFGLGFGLAWLLRRTRADGTRGPTATRTTA